MNRKSICAPSSAVSLYRARFSERLTSSLVVVGWRKLSPTRLAEQLKRPPELGATGPGQRANGTEYGNATFASFRHARWEMPAGFIFAASVIKSIFAALIIDHKRPGAPLRVFRFRFHLFKKVRRGCYCCLHRHFQITHRGETVAVVFVERSSPVYQKMHHTR